MIGARAQATRAPHAFPPAGARIVFACVSLLALFAARPAWCLWQTFGLADGLVDLPVRSIAADHSGSLWFATATGVSRYDGAVFQTFSLPQLKNADVRAVFTDRTGRVWFGTGGGVSAFDGSGWVSYVDTVLTLKNDVRGMFQDHTGAMWFATALGASRFDGAIWTSYTNASTYNGLASNMLSSVLEDHTGAVWFGTQGFGVSRMDSTGWTTYTKSSTGGMLGDDFIECVLETHDGVIWVGTRFGGLSRFDRTRNTWSPITTAGALTLVDVTGLSEDRFGRLWVACDRGLARFDGLAWRSFTNANGLAGNILSALAIDGSGNVWAAAQDGVSRYDGESWTKFTTAGLAWGAEALLEARDGIVWAGTAGGGVARYDRSVWMGPLTHLSTGGGLASDSVFAVVQDSTGALWFGTTAGASRLVGTAWSTFTDTTVSGGPIGNNVIALARDSSGAIWFGTTSGLSRFDGSVWTPYSTVNTSGGLPADSVNSLLVARDGSLWCGTTSGVGHLQGGTWTRYTTSTPNAGLAHNNVLSILQDPTGAIWFGTLNGLSRFDPGRGTWTTPPDLASNTVLSLAETPDSVLWVGTYGSGVSRFDGALWHTYTTQDGLPYATVSAAAAEHSGSLWFGTPAGAALYEPARVPPQTVIIAGPPPLSTSRLQTVHFVAAFRQIVGIEFATRFNNEPWSDWLPGDSWLRNNLTDGIDTLRVVARDVLHHADPTPAMAVFEVAATPPAPVITSPVFRQPVRDTLVVRGTATARRFRSWRLDMRPSGTSSPWDSLAGSLRPVVDSVLVKLETKPLPDGNYDLRLAVQDTLGLTGSTTVTYIIDNLPPWAYQTTPALVSALNGGDVWTTNREAHVYIPPRGLPRDAVVHLDPLDPTTVPATLPDGAIRVASGYAVSMEGVPLQKTAALDLTVSGDVAPPGMNLTLYVAGSDSVWRPLGGTLDAARISTPFTGAGSYAIFGAVPRASAAAGALSLTLTPRVLASRGPLASSSVKIGFVLPRPGTVRITIHNRAGRLVRTVVSGETLGAGTNLVSWDGKDEDHHDVEGGLYLVTIEALGEAHTQTLGVVR